ncbi:MAG: hypothetical protein NTW96_22685 [Planctomycetia bacterium]|nr:hypothetical protein [Planctomycetia bacterium]
MHGQPEPVANLRDHLAAALPLRREINRPGKVLAKLGKLALPQPERRRRFAGLGRALFGDVLQPSGQTVGVALAEPGPGQDDLAAGVERAGNDVDRAILGPPRFDAHSIAGPPDAESHASHARLAEIADPSLLGRQRRVRLNRDGQLDPPGSRTR